MGAKLHISRRINWTLCDYHSYAIMTLRHQTVDDHRQDGPVLPIYTLRNKEKLLHVERSDCLSSHDRRGVQYSQILPSSLALAM